MIELFGLEKAEMKFFLHHRGHHLSTDLDVFSLFDLLANLDGALNGLPFLHHRLYCRGDELLALCCLFLLFLGLSELLWLFFRLHP